MADDMVESVESGVEAQVASATSGRVENPGGGCPERRVGESRPSRPAVVRGGGAIASVAAVRAARDCWAATGVAAAAAASAVPAVKATRDCWAAAVGAAAAAAAGV
jgi:anti-sigma factor RsiW